MPLIKSKSRKAVGQNIKAEMAAGKPQDQAVAIALSTQREAGGGKPKPGDKAVESGDKRGRQRADPNSEPATVRTRKRVPARDGMRKRLAARIASGGAL
jgi:hypothetical protein